MKDPNKVLEQIKQMENMVGQSAFNLERREDIKVQIRVDEKVGPAKFRPDPLIPNGYIANSLTIRAMRPDIFVLGDSTDDLSVDYQCACGEIIDLQFWKLCPFCAREIHS
ncbi:MAG: hypothetical protein AB7I27_09390 [Bacteriovoracaceae bacterium]